MSTSPQQTTLPNNSVSVADAHHDSKIMDVAVPRTTPAPTEVIEANVAAANVVEANINEPAQKKQKMNDESSTDVTLAKPDNEDSTVASGHALREVFKNTLQAMQDVDAKFDGKAGTFAEKYKAKGKVAEDSQSELDREMLEAFLESQEESMGARMEATLAEIKAAGGEAEAIKFVEEKLLATGRTLERALREKLTKAWEEVEAAYERGEVGDANVADVMMEKLLEASEEAMEVGQESDTPQVEEAEVEVDRNPMLQPNIDEIRAAETVVLTGEPQDQEDQVEETPKQDGDENAA